MGVVPVFLTVKNIRFETDYSICFEWDHVYLELCLGMVCLIVVLV